MEIRADLSENMLNSGYFITILHKNSVKLSTALRKASAPFTVLHFTINLLDWISSVKIWKNVV